MELVTLIGWLFILVLAAIIVYRILALAPISPLMRALIEIGILLIALVLLIQWLGPLPSLWVRFWLLAGNSGCSLAAGCWLLAAGPKLLLAVSQQPTASSQQPITASSQQPAANEQAAVRQEHLAYLENHDR